MSDSTQDKQNPTFKNAVLSQFEGVELNHQQLERLQALQALSQASALDDEEPLERASEIHHPEQSRSQPSNKRLNRLNESKVFIVALIDIVADIKAGIVKGMQACHAHIGAKGIWTVALSSVAVLGLVINLFWSQHASIAPVKESAERFTAVTISAIAAEVAKNHIKVKPLEVSSPSINELSQYFTQLDFSPIASRLTGELFKGARLMGGRYCSIQGVTAAQLRFQSNPVSKVDQSLLLQEGGESFGVFSSLYEVSYDAKLFGELPHIERGEAPIVEYSKGVKVVLWVEKGLLMAATFSG